MIFEFGRRYSSASGWWGEFSLTRRRKLPGVWWSSNTPGSRKFKFG
jgi:hypothetical protein